MKKITQLLAIAVALLWTTSVFAAINTTTAWWNGETFESYAAGTDFKAAGATAWSGWTTSYFVQSQSITASTTASATGNVMGFALSNVTALGEVSAGGTRTFTKSNFTTLTGGYVYGKTCYFTATGGNGIGTNYTLKNSTGGIVFEFGAVGTTTNNLWITGVPAATMALGARSKWNDIEFVLDLANNKASKVIVTYSGTSKTFTDITLAAGGNINSLLVTEAKGWDAGGLDNTTLAQLVADNIKTLSGVSTLQTLSSAPVTSEFNVSSFTTAMGLDLSIAKTDLDVVWSISDYGTLSVPDQALVSITRSATDFTKATLSAGTISADATVTLSAVYGGTTLTKTVALTAGSIDGLKATLLSEINAANALMTAVTDNNPYIASAKNTLTGVIDASQLIYNNSTSAESVTTAISDMQAANTAFSAAMTPYNVFVAYIGTVQTAHNAEIRTASFFVAIKATLQSAIDVATAARTTISVGADITSTKSTLEAALAQFNLDIPAYSGLETSISTVVSRLAVVTPRQGDNRFLMFTTSAVSDLSSAKTTADGILSSATTVLELTIAKANLDAALISFNGIPRVAPATSNYYKIYTFGSDNGDLSATKSILFASADGLVLKYAAPGNALLTADNCLWQVGLGSVAGKYTLMNKATGTYLAGTGFSATAVDLSLPENTSLTNLINAPTDTYFVYGIVNSSSKGLEVDAYDNVTTSTGTFLINSAIANRFRFAYQFEPVTSWNGTGVWNTDAANWSFGTVPTTDAEAIVQTGELTLNQTVTLSKVSVLSGSTLKGTGTISGATTVNGILQGRLSFGSDLILAGTTKIVVDGFTAGQYDVVTVAGAVTFGGVLEVTVNGENPAKGTAIQIINFASQTGDFVQPITAPTNYSFDKTTGTLTYDGTTGMSENGLNNVSIYPTLSRGMITITGDVTNVEIVNLAGQVVKQVNLNGKTTVNLSNLPTGAYFVKVRAIDGSLKVQKVIYQK